MSFGHRFRNHGTIVNILANWPVEMGKIVGLKSCTNWAHALSLGHILFCYISVFGIQIQRGCFSLSLVFSTLLYSPSQCSSFILCYLPFSLSFPISMSTLSIDWRVWCVCKCAHFLGKMSIVLCLFQKSALTLCYDSHSSSFCKKYSGPDGLLSWLEYHLIHQNVVGLIAGQGVCLGCWFDHQLGHVQRQLINVSHADTSFSLSTAFFPL